MLHPATKIILWLICAVVAQRLQPLLLLGLTAALLALLGGFRAANFLALLRRTRWILVSLLLIYAFATPGLYLFPQLAAASPTLEGLRAGGLQAWRLAVLLAALALLLHTTDRVALLSGLYVLLRPLRPLGVDAERIAVRLWLTLHYAEAAPEGPRGTWRERLARTLEPGDGTAQTLGLEVRRLGWADGLALGAALALSMAAW